MGGSMLDELYIYSAKPIRVVDGDTIHLRVDLGLRCFTVIEGRFARIDAPEKNRRRTKKAGLAALAYVEEFIKRGEIFIKTQPVKSKDMVREKQGSFSRWIIEVLVEYDGFIHNLNDEMVKDGHAIYKEY